ncbi:MAG: restriction endonuclease subunit S [Clostridia bacterium]|nr:restriction endonuclease subunit S [Clostridia bacterium]
MKYKLSDLFELQMGKTPSRDNTEYWSQPEYPWVSIADLSGAGKYIYATKESISRLAIEESGIKTIPANTVIMSFKLSIGKVSITPIPMYSNEAIMAFIDKGITTIKPEYLYYLLLHRDWDEGTNKAVMGKTLNKATLSDVVIDVHSIEDQDRIVAVLDKVSDIIERYQKQLNTLDILVKARFIEMFGEPRLNPHDYPVHQLSEHIQFLTSGSRGWAQYCVDDGKEWFITIKNVKDCHISTANMQAINAPDNAEAKRTRVEEGDLLISITADLGRTGVVTQEIAEHGAYINQHLTCIRLNRKVLEPLYVAYFMESAAGKEQFVSKNQSAVKAGLNFNSINTLQILIPPIEIQQQFLRFVSQVDKSKVVVQKALDEAKLLFESLMQKYFG